MHPAPKFCWNDGQKIADKATFPYECWACGTMNYRPIRNVVAVIVPLIGSGVSTMLCVRRIGGPTDGQLALPGGYRVSGETWQETGAREVREEIGLDIEPDSLILRSLTTVEGDLNLVICEAAPIHPPAAFKPDGVEVSEVVAITGPVETAFPIHTDAIAAFFAIAQNEPVPDSPTFVPAD